jgi:hypothetical protein
MKKTTILALVLVTLGLTTTAFAQTTVNSTTTAAAVTVTDRQVRLTSASTVAVRDILYIDQEAMSVTAINGVYATVARGVEGTRAAAHSTLARVYTGPRLRFAQPRPARGACTRTAETYLPRIVPSTGEIWDCLAGAGVWIMTSGSGPARTVECFVGVLITSNVDQTCFIADRAYYVARIQEIHTTAESGGTLTLIPRRQQGTEAAASGDALATAIDMVGAGAVAQTLKTATLTTTTSDLILNAGDRLGLDFTDDTAGELAGVIVEFTLIAQ